MRSVLVLGGLLLSACGGVSHGAMGTPPVAGASQQCRVAASHENPLVTEWPAPEKASLEARLRQGPVVVAYSGCDLELLTQCQPTGRYAWLPTTVATDTVVINDEDELYAKLPLGAVTLVGELKRSGRLNVTTTAGGQFRLQGFTAQSVPSGPECAQATHVVTALSVGTFEMRSGGTTAVSGGADVGAVGDASGATRREESLVRQAGDAAQCVSATVAAPHPDCASPLQVFLTRLPETVTDRGPPGAVKVSFYGSEPNDQWTVAAGDRELCEAPCEKWLDPRTPVQMKYGFTLLNPQGDSYPIEGLTEHPPGSRLTAIAEPTNGWEFSGGLSLTTLGGVATVAGIALIAVGAGTGSSGLAWGGVGAFVPGGLALGGGIYMLVDSAGGVKLVPADPVAGPQEPSVAR